MLAHRSCWITSHGRRFTVTPNPVIPWLSLRLYSTTWIAKNQYAQQIFRCLPVVFFWNLVCLVDVEENVDILFLYPLKDQ